MTRYKSERWSRDHWRVGKLTTPDVDVENFGKRTCTSNNGLIRSFKAVRKREEVDMQWVRATVAAAFSMRFFDNVEVRKTVLMTVECGENYIRTKPGGVKKTTLSHHTFFTTKLIPKLDKLINDKNMGKMRTMTQDLTTTVFSEGWTTVNHHPIVNIIMGVRSLHNIIMGVRSPEAFHVQYMKSDIHVWINTFFKS